MNYNQNNNQASKPNTGSMFTNDRKQSQNQPDLKGKINVGGVDYYISGWNRQAKSSGQNYIGLSVTPVSEAQRPAQQGNAYPSNNQNNQYNPQQGNQPQQNMGFNNNNSTPQF